MIRYTIPSIAPAEAFSVTENEESTISALLFYAGSHDNGIDKADYSDEDIQRIYEATLAWMKERKVKLFSSPRDHEISNEFQIGTLTGLELRKIESSDVFRSQTNLIGVNGIFGTITLTSEGRKRYADGTLDEISIGLSSEGVIVEISAVAIPALAAARVFSKNPIENLNLISGEKMSIEKLLWRLQGQLGQILGMSEKELNGQSKESLVARVTGDFLKALQNSSEEKETADPTNFSLPPIVTTVPTPKQMDNNTPPPFDSESRYKLLTAYVALSDRRNALKDSAISLMSSGQLSKKEYDTHFSTKVPMPDTFESPALAEQTYTETGRSLDKIEAVIAYVKENPPVRYGMPVSGNPIPVDEEKKKVEEEELAMVRNYAMTMPLHKSY